jgi:uncharacterized protein (TIGR03435 family)
LTATGITIPILANGLSQVIPEISRLVVDRTGLTGTFDIDVRWGSESATVRADRGPFSTPPLDGNAPTFFTALQEQLGLKLESTRGPVPVVVVESVGAPTPN